MGTAKRARRAGASKAAAKHAAEARTTKKIRDEGETAPGDGVPVKTKTKSYGEADRKPVKSKLKFASAMPREEAVAYFEAIVNGLRKGAIQFRRGEEMLSVTPAGHVEVEVKASRKGAKETVSFEITWRAEDTDLAISAS